jgi:hypothetical protein
LQFVKFKTILSDPHSLSFQAQVESHITASIQYASAFKQIEFLKGQNLQLQNKIAVLATDKCKNCSLPSGAGTCNSSAEEWSISADSCRQQNARSENIRGNQKKRNPEISNIYTAEDSVNGNSNQIQPPGTSLQKKRKGSIYDFQ